MDNQTDNSGPQSATPDAPPLRAFDPRDFADDSTDETALEATPVDDAVEAVESFDSQSATVAHPTTAGNVDELKPEATETKAPIVLSQLKLPLQKTGETTQEYFKRCQRLLEAAYVNAGHSDGPPSKASEYYPAIGGIELDDEPEISVNAYIEGFILAGCLNGIVGPPKAGKTTLLFNKLLPLLEREPTKLSGPILYVTEQSKRSFKAQLDRLPADARRRLLRSKLPNGKPAFLVMHPEHHHVEKDKDESDWQRHLRLWESVIRKYDSSIIVIDTFGVYADLGPQGENDNTLLARRLSDLQRLIALKESLAVVLVLHSNKAGSTNQSKTYLRLTDIRGGSAYAGGLDNIVLINRPRQQDKVSQTLYVSIESRLVDEEQFTLTLQEGGSYLRKGGEADKQPKKQANPAQKKIADAVAGDPSLATLSLRDLVKTLGVKKNQVEKWKKDHAPKSSNV